MSSCPLELQLAGGCSDGDEVVIGDIIDDPGSGGGGSGPGWGGVPDPDFGQPRDDWDLSDCLDAWDGYIGCFLAPLDPGDPDEPVAIPPITIVDIERFAPDGSSVAAEPQNVGVVGLPTNFVAGASVHTVDGTLFGVPLTVRFTPVSYVFDFGDGSALTAASGGASWSVLGQAEFTPTATSHAYAARGTYAASVDVHYTAEVDLGFGWYPIAGEVVAAGPPQQVRIFEARTGLVDRTCAEDPASPGCG